MRGSRLEGRPRVNIVLFIQLITLPSTHQLTLCASNNWCRIFNGRTNFIPEGHGTTDYPLWFMQRHNELRAIPCFRSNRYEPYMVR